MRVATGLIEDQHPGLRAGLNVDRVETGAIARDDQEIRRALQKVRMDMKMRRKLVTRGADLIGVRLFDDRREDILRTFVLETIKPDVCPGFQNIDVDRVGEIFDIEDTLVVDSHRSAFSSENGAAGIT